MKRNAWIGITFAVVIAVALMLVPRWGNAAPGTAPVSPAMLAALGPDGGSKVRIELITTGQYDGKLIAMGSDWAVVDLSNGSGTVWIARSQVKSILVPH